MSFFLLNKALRLNNLKTRAAMKVKVSVFVVYVEAIMYLLLHNLHDCTFNTLLSKIIPFFSISFTYAFQISTL